eukprot:GHVN01001739.1.p2 GENE.GHVN01001739.1~~GHVN01001739.1.p2  ORF type:complete len:818 (+),score=148.83 GHVN01001739.1:45-2456(+)
MATPGVGHGAPRRLGPTKFKPDTQMTPRPVSFQAVSVPCDNQEILQRQRCVQQSHLRHSHFVGFLQLVQSPSSNRTSDLTSVQTHCSPADCEHLHGSSLPGSTRSTSVHKHFFPAVLFSETETPSLELFDGRLNHSSHELHLTHPGYYALVMENRCENRWASLMYFGFNNISVTYSVAQPPRELQDSVTSLSSHHVSLNPVHHQRGQQRSTPPVSFSPTSPPPLSAPISLSAEPVPQPPVNNGAPSPRSLQRAGSKISVGSFSRPRLIHLPSSHGDTHCVIDKRHNSVTILPQQMRMITFQILTPDSVQSHGRCLPLLSCPSRSSLCHSLDEFRLTQERAQPSNPREGSSIAPSTISDQSSRDPIAVLSISAHGYNADTHYAIQYCGEPHSSPFNAAHPFPTASRYTGHPPKTVSTPLPPWSPSRLYHNASSPARSHSPPPVPTFNGNTHRLRGECCRILTLDGGGVLGLSSLYALQAIEAEVRLMSGDSSIELIELFDLIGGTSTGALIALGLIGGKSVSEMIEEWGSTTALLFEGRNTPTAALSGLLFDSYDVSNTRKVFGEKLGYRYLNSLPEGPYCFVTSTDVAHSPYRPFLLRTYTHTHRWHHEYAGVSNVPMAVAGWAAAAAPTLLKGPSPEDLKTMGLSFDPPVQLVDGALVANNPSLVALQEAAQLLGKDSLASFVENDLEVIVSVGTGQPLIRRTNTTGNIEATTWQILSNAASVLVNSNSTHRQILPLMANCFDKYHRFNAPGISDIALNSSDVIDLERIKVRSREYLTEEKRFDLRRIAHKLLLGINMGQEV